MNCCNNDKIKYILIIDPNDVKEWDNGFPKAMKRKYGKFDRTVSKIDYNEPPTPPYPQPHTKEDEVFISSISKPITFTIK